MVVRTICKGREATGLRLRAEDAARYFSPQITAIQLRLGDVQIECELPADFRTGRPEIFDDRLSGWLEFKIFRTRPCRVPVSFDLTPLGANVYTMDPPSGCDRMSCTQFAAYAAEQNPRTDPARPPSLPADGKGSAACPAPGPAELGTG